MVLAGGYLAVSLFVAVRFSAPNREPPERTPANAGLEYREVSFESVDGVPLEAWWVPPAEGESSRAAVLVHGWGGDKSDEPVIETAPIYDLESVDGVPLEAWWVPPAEGESSRAAVLVHGWGGDKSDEPVIETAPIYAL